MFLSAFVASCFGVHQVPPHPFQPGETVLYKSRGVTHGRAPLSHASGMKLGEVTGFPREGQVQVTPWDYPNRFYPGGVVGLDGRPKDGSEELPESEVFHEVSCVRNQSGREFRVGFDMRLQVGRSRFEARRAMRIFENGYGLFFRNSEDEESYSHQGNSLFFEKGAPTLIRFLPRE
jgi:hypothetical protein